MATQASLDQIQNLYIAFYGRPADLAGQTYWADELEAANGDLTAIIDAFASSEEYDSQYGDLTNEELVNALYQQILGRDAEQAGLDFYVGELEAGNITEGGIALAILNGATGDDSITMANRKAVADEFTAAVEAGDKEYGDDQLAAAKALLSGVTSETDPATVDVDTVVDAFPAAEEPVDPGTPGEEFSLTASTDALTGTENDDLFEGYLSQNSFSGGVSNTLSSADRIDGGEGTDTLDVELVDEFVGSTTGNNIDVQPRTSSVEVIEVEARELTGGNNTITLDAKNMTDIDRIGSHFSDADLVIENLTTLTEDGEIRLTSDMTVVMEHTDNFNSDSDASDLTVLFDEDYLNTSTTSGGSTLLVRLVNAVTNVTNDNPIFGTDSFTFMVGETEVAVDVSDIAADDTLDYTTAYNQVVNAINAAAADAGFDNVNATLQPLSPTVFSLPVTVDGTDYEPGDSAGSYYPILITNSGSEELGKGSFTQGQVNTDTDINSTMNPAPATESEVPISINVELEKVGRDGEGGNLTIGGKDWQSTGNTDTDQDQNNGIEIFNISVVGDASKPSNLGQIISTDGALETVNIVTADTSLDSFAALTVRGEDTNGADTTPFGGTLDTLNANGFLGNLQIGQSDASRAIDIETFTATGGGDVTFWSSIGEQDADGLESLGNLAYSATTGAGADTINADIAGGAQYTVTTGAGNDTVVATVNGDTDSGSTDSKIIVNSAGGNNTVTVTSNDSAHDADIDLGSGSDTVNGNSLNINADTGAGNDAIYAENTGEQATARLAAGTFGAAADAATGVVTEAQLLNGREVTVTVAMPEETTATAVEAVDFVNGYELEAFTFESDEVLSTERELYEAVANAINSDEIINKLVEATVDSNGNLIVTYLVDGSTIDAEQLVEINVSDEYAVAADIPADLLTAVQQANNDSTITAANVLTGYDAVTTDVYAITGTAAAIEFDITTLTDNDDITFTVNGQSVTLVEGTDYTGTGTLETDLAGLSVTVDGITYAVSSTAANNITLTQTSDYADYTIAAVGDATIIDETLAAAVDSTAVTSGVFGNNGTDSTTAGNNTVNGGIGDDVIVLSSNDDEIDTVVFDTAEIGDDVIVHFEAGAGGDVLDFTAWLDGLVSASGSTESQVRVDTTLVGLTDIVANSVVVEDFDQVQTAFGTGAITFDTLTDTQLLAALNGTAAGGNAATFQHDATASLVGSSGKAILLIQNDDDGDGAVDAGDNFGEYLVAEVTFADDGATNNVQDSFSDVKIIGTIDLGEATTFNVDNFA